MDTTKKIALTFALIWIIIKMILFNMGLSLSLFNYTVMINVFFLLVVIFMTLHYYKNKTNKEDSTFLGDFKEAMKGGAIYSFVIVVFIFIYFTFIDTNFVESKMADIQTMSIDFEELRESKPEFKLKSNEDIISELKATQKAIFSPFLSTTIVLTGMMMATFIYSMLGSIFFRKVLSRVKK